MDYETAYMGNIKGERKRFKNSLYFFKIEVSWKEKQQIEHDFYSSNMPTFQGGGIFILWVLLGCCSSNHYGAKASVLCKMGWLFRISSNTNTNLQERGK